LQSGDVSLDSGVVWARADRPARMLVEASTTESFANLCAATFADMLPERAGVKNTVWLTADMHYTAAHYYDPDRAMFSDFEPFWEFVSGPLHAGSWDPAALDNTFGPEVRS
jgi:phosphodiesterase/alkaline phosphatase D-like protein